MNKTFPERRVTHIGGPMEQTQFPFEDDILALAQGQEYIVFIKGRPFVITPATEDTAEKIGRGFYCMD
jgi:hypothetical protein